MRPWSEQTSDEAFACLDQLTHLISLGVECGLNDEDSEKYVRAVHRLGEILPAPRS